LSVEAVHDRLICEGDTAEAVRPVGAEGAVVSAGDAVLALAAADWAEAFPAASIAWTV
jgi:2-polyprenyl-6-methoxyphenol hydroxylase-like FAD-dependent oxidoreductase